MIYGVIKNNEIIKGKLFTLPEPAIDFLKENFMAEHQNAKFEEIKKELLNELKEYGYISIKADNDEWEIKKYISNNEIGFY